MIPVDTVEVYKTRDEIIAAYRSGIFYIRPPKPTITLNTIVNAKKITVDVNGAFKNTNAECSVDDGIAKPLLVDSALFILNQYNFILNDLKDLKTPGDYFSSHDDHTDQLNSYIEAFEKTMEKLKRLYEINVANASKDGVGHDKKSKEYIEAVYKHLIKNYDPNTIDWTADFKNILEVCGF